eukprot:TRINITY_DN4954_c2_g1_i2.p1 TRINITY_DN4954_c2_g1~~TRINITY_DN4954_c2_g1_i2.p1  ORF type:complete len:471 (+),score=115.89 TRINITY_DN4954_c2_g1_i2:191-1414(+)
MNDPNLLVCGVCSVGRNPKSQSIERETQPKKFRSDPQLEATIGCPHCGVSLNPSAFDEHVALHLMEDDPELQRLRQRYGFESKDKDSSSYQEQYQRKLEYQWSKNLISDDELQSRKRNLTQQLDGPDTSSTSGIISIISRSYDRSRGVTAKALSSPVEHFHSDMGDQGWGCGYRNIQMLTSYLLTISPYKKAIFGGNGYVPTVPKIQEFLENSWALGFDVQGAHQLGNSIANSKKMIGATECAILMRSFGLRAEVYDFYSSKKSPEEVARIQFKNEEMSKSSQKWKKFESIYKPNKKLLEWVENYYLRKTPFSQKHFLPPLYLQHEGHSRTIVGAEKRGDRINLWVFDPGHDLTKILQDPTGKGLFKLKKNLDQFTKDRYQIVVIQPGLMSPDEMEASKVITTTRIG